ncbi:MAG: hypothetical protein IT406_00445 [Candidatus Yanofskybacteria bacterium]|nr:hypothetical protein [Candidatus Yanofskybacteria bacterium]
MDINYWYYPLSAIPQTLAAMIALAATFAAVKLDVFSKKLAESRKDLRRFILLVTTGLNSDEKEIHTIEPLSNLEFLNLYKKGLAGLKSGDPAFGLEPATYAKYQQEMYRIINSEWNSFFSAKDFRILGYLSMKKDTFEDLLQKRIKIIRWTTQSLVFAAIVAGISLAILPCFKYFHGSILIVGLITGVAVLSILATAFNVWRIARMD